MGYCRTQKSEAHKSQKPIQEGVCWAGVHLGALGMTSMQRPCMLPSSDLHLGSEGSNLLLILPPEAFCSLLKTLNIISISVADISKQNWFWNFFSFHGLIELQAVLQINKAHRSLFSSPGEERECY